MIYSCVSEGSHVPSSINNAIDIQVETRSSEPKAK